MKVRYDKKEIKGIRYSSIFMLFIISLCLLFTIPDRELAVLIVIAPVMILLLVKNVRVLAYIHLIKKDDFYLELNNTKLTCNSIFEGNVEIELENIKNIQFNDDGIFLYLKRDVVGKKVKLRELFKYYLENNECIYKISVLGERIQMKQICDMLKEKIEVTYIKEDVQEFSGLCGAYIFILVGSLWGFLFQILWQTNLQQNLLKLLLLLVVMTFIHIFDKRFLYSNQVSLGLLVRCIGCSMTIAQYILCACQIEEMVENINIGLSVSVQSFAVVSIIYLFIFILFLLRNGLGKKITLYCIQKRNKQKVR